MLLILDYIDDLFCCLQEGVFVNLHQLKTLHFSSNSIASVGLRVFDESANLTSLSTIDLSHNDMTELEPWPIIRAQHRPTSVYLRANRIRKFTNALQWSFSCNSTRVFDTELDMSGNRMEHITDVVDGWNISDGMTLYY